MDACAYVGPIAGSTLLGNKSMDGWERAFSLVLSEVGRKRFERLLRSGYMNDETGCG